MPGASKLSVTPAPEWLRQELHNRGRDKKADGFSLPDEIRVKKRNDTLTSLAGRLRWAGFEEPEILASLLAINRNRCELPLEEEEVAKIAASIANRYPVGDWVPPYSFTTEKAAAQASPWPQLDEAAFHGLAGDFVEQVEPHTEADSAGLLVQFLIAWGNKIGSGPHFTVEANRHAMNLFCVLVGETAVSRKGTSIGHVRRPFRAVDEAWDRDQIHFGLSSGEGLIWAVRDPIEEFKKQKGIYEMVVTDPGVKDKRALIIEAEFASTLRVMNRDTNTLSPVIRNAWDGSDLRIMTKNSPARATGAHISIIGHITKSELLQHLNRTEMGNGFGNRFLWLCVKRSKCLPEGGSIQSVDFGPFLKNLSDMSAMAVRIPEITRDDEARELWADVYPELSSGKPGLLGAMIARAPAQTMRLACIYAALDFDNKIRVPHLKAALALWQYCEDSARYIFGQTLGHPLADSILSLLKANPAGLTRTELHERLSRNKSAAQLDLALRMLVEQQLISAETRQTGGRPAVVYKAEVTPT